MESTRKEETYTYGLCVCVHSSSRLTFCSPLICDMRFSLILCVVSIYLRGASENDDADKKCQVSLWLAFLAAMTQRIARRRCDNQGGGK